MRFRRIDGFDGFVVQFDNFDLSPAAGCIGMAWWGARFVGLRTHVGYQRILLSAGVSAVMVTAVGSPDSVAY